MQLNSYSYTCVALFVSGWWYREGATGNKETLFGTNGDTHCKPTQKASKYREETLQEPAKTTGEGESKFNIYFCFTQSYRLVG